MSVAGAAGVAREAPGEIAPAAPVFVFCSVCPEGAYHQWRKIPPRELSIDLVADERFGRVTGRAGAS